MLKDKVKFFLFVSCVLYIMVIIWIMVQHGEGLKDYFVSSSAFGDLFSPMNKMRINTYTAPFYSNYPPLANIFFLCLKRIIPKESLYGYEGIVNSFSSKLLVVFYFIIGLTFLRLSIKKLIHKMNNNYSVFWGELAAFFIMSSGVFVYLYTRANILLFVVILILFFATFYDSENKIMSELALISLAISTGLKIYPIVFGVFLIKKDNVKKILRTVLYGIVFCVLPFFCYDGFKTIKFFFENLFSRNETFYLNHAISFKGSLMMIYGAFTGKILNVSNIVLLIPLFVGIFIFASSEERWKKWFAACLWIIWLPNGSYLYNLTLLCVPLIMLLFDKQNKTIHYVYLMLFVITTLPMFFPEVYKLNRILEYNQLGHVSWNIVIDNMVFWILVAIIIVENLFCLIKDRFKIRNVNRNIMEDTYHDEEGSKA